MKEYQVDVHETTRHTLSGVGDVKMKINDVIKEIKSGDAIVPGFDGYEIVTEGGMVIRALVSNAENCCESWGYMSSEDDLNDYIGATLLSIKVIDENLDEKTAWQSRIYEEANGSPWDEGGAMFVNVNTDRGTFQIAVYNSHNGYYGHEAMVTVDDKVLENDCL